MEAKDETAVTDQQNGDSPHENEKVIEGHSTVNVNTGELLWEPDKVSQNS